MILQNNGKDYESIPLGLHRAVCVNFFDLGFQPGYQGKPPKHECVILWEIDARKSDGKPFTITKRYTASLYKKATLGKHLASWRTRPFTEEEENGFNTDTLIGVNCQLNIVEIKKDNGDTRAEVDGVLPPPKNLEGRYEWTTMHAETDPTYTPDWSKEAMSKQLPPPNIEETRVPATIGPDNPGNDIPF